MTQVQLKRIAILSMLLDHTAKVVLKSSLLSPLMGMETEQALRTFMIIVGRMAFPIFAWFVAEGCRKTSNSAHYLLRLGIFALLSEIPFQLCFYGKLTFACHNVLFTLLLAALAILLGNRLRQAGIFCFLPSVVAVALGWMLQTDYNAWGILLVIGLYYMPTEQGQLLYLASWVTVFQLIWHGWNGLSGGGGSSSLQLLYWIGGLSAIPLLATYTGERGKGGRWLFYLFYPCHLLSLYYVSGISG